MTVQTHWWSTKLPCQGFCPRSYTNPPPISTVHLIPSHIFMQSPGSKRSSSKTLQGAWSPSPCHPREDVPDRIKPRRARPPASPGQGGNNDVTLLAIAGIRHLKPSPMPQPGSNHDNNNDDNNNSSAGNRGGQRHGDNSCSRGKKKKETRSLFRRGAGGGRRLHVGCSEEEEESDSERCRDRGSEQVHTKGVDVRYLAYLSKAIFKTWSIQLKLIDE